MENKFKRIVCLEARKRGSGGGSPRKYDNLPTGPSEQDVQSRQLWSCASSSAPSEARKRGSGGGSPRKLDDLLTGPLDQDVHSRQLWSAVFEVRPPNFLRLSLFPWRNPRPGLASLEHSHLCRKREKRANRDEEDSFRASSTRLASPTKKRQQTGVWGRIPQEHDDWFSDGILPSDVLQHLASPTNDSGPSEARKPDTVMVFFAFFVFLKLTGYYRSNLPISHNGRLSEWLRSLT